MLIAFDITNEQSFESVKTWMSSIYKHADANIAKVLIGNKLDLDHERIISRSCAEKLAKEHGMEYFETSAKDSINIQEVMSYIMERVYENLYSQGTADSEEDHDGKQSVVLGAKN